MFSSHASLDTQSRLKKAEKITRLLRLDQSNAMLDILEIGAGSGGVSHGLALLFPGRMHVTAIDVTDQRSELEGYNYALYDGRRLPFADRTFDIVISNHVIEHILGRVNQSLHLAEIARILRSDGRCYLATPSRWQVIEPHFKLPFLSWLPRRLRNHYVRWFSSGQDYDCDPLSPAEIENIMYQQQLAFISMNVAAAQDLCAHERAGSCFASLVRLVPSQALTALRRLSPTMIYIVSKR